MNPPIKVRLELLLKAEAGGGFSGSVQVWESGTVCLSREIIVLMHAGENAGGAPWSRSVHLRLEKSLFN